MADVESKSEVVAALAEEFVERYRRGELHTRFVEEYLREQGIAGLAARDG